MVFNRVRAVAVVLVGFAILATTPAVAQAVQTTPPPLTIAGDPTAEERVEITVQWERLMTRFPAAAGCVAPVTVEVVDSAEAAWGGGIQGIAAFYRRSRSTVYVEHGKVHAEHLIHEFAHHLDFSCGFGSGDLGRRFTAVQGFESGHDWVRGTGWSDIPAEHFAEAVVALLGIDSVDLPITPSGLALVASFAAGVALKAERSPASPLLLRI